jgi:heptosyltransferase-3
LKVLIVRACAVGDFVLNLPALRAMQNVRKNARFTLVGYPSKLEFAREFIAVDQILSIESEPWCRLFYDSISGLDFDLAVIWMKDPVVADNLRRSGVADVFRGEPFPVHGHAADHLLRTLGLARPALPDLWRPHSENMLFSAGSGSARKNWPYFEELKSRLPQATEVSLSVRLKELTKVFQHCRAYIGNDSGLTHLAAYVGCPTIALFGPTDPRVWGPIGRRARVIWKTKLEDISVDEVLQTLHGTHAGT